MNRVIRIAVSLSLLVSLSACETLFSGGNYEKKRQGASSSLVDFLYPAGGVPAQTPEGLPHLNLPLRVGIAFVPSYHYDALSETTRTALLDRVAAAFADRPYISAIETIPESYLKSTRGVLGMQQVARLFSVDAIALVSYDQLSVLAERDSALLYWTVVGAMVVKGNSSEVQTFIDTAVFDVNTARLLFRAPGTHVQQKNSNLLDADKDLRALQTDGFAAANEQMIVNLNHELETFRTAVKNGERAQVAWRSGSFGGGSNSAALLLLFAAALFARWISRGRKRKG